MACQHSTSPCSSKRNGMPRRHSARLKSCHHGDLYARVPLNQPHDCTALTSEAKLFPRDISPLPFSSSKTPEAFLTLSSALCLLLDPVETLTDSCLWSNKTPSLCTQWRDSVRGHRSVLCWIWRHHVIVLYEWIFVQLLITVTDMGLSCPVCLCTIAVYSHLPTAVEMGSCGFKAFHSNSPLSTTMANVAHMLIQNVTM